MAEDDATQWFSAVFTGAWIEVPAAAEVPADIIEESRRNAGRWLTPAADPYCAGVAPEQRIYLGKQLSPDKLITTGAVTQLVETLQHFAVGQARPSMPVPVRRHEALLAVRTGLIPMLADQAARIVEKAVGDALALSPDNELPGPGALRLSLPGPPLAALGHWSDLVGLFWFVDRVRIDFLKIEPHGAAPLFKPGLDWFPAVLRRRCGTLR